MLEISTEKLLTLEDIETLYASGDEKLYHDYDLLLENILVSDYLITLRQDDEICGLIRSNGDGCNTQYISEIVMKANMPHQGFGSKLLDAYLDATSNVNKIYVVSHDYYRTNFSKTWLQYKGFKILADNDGVIVYLLDRKFTY